MAEDSNELGVVSEWRGGYGFIHANGGGRDVFVHHSAIIGDRHYRELFVGQRVSFVRGEDDRGRPRAKDVRVVEG